MAGDRLPDELMKSLMPAAQYEAWKRQEETSREFWRTLRGPAQRPLGSNADQWHLFLEENKDALPYLAAQIAEAIEEAERRGKPFDEQSCPGHVASRLDPKICGRCGVHIDSLRPPNDDYSY